MKKLFLSVLLFNSIVFAASAQEEEPEKQPEEKKGFKKENLFTGGGISFGLGFSSGVGNTFSIGASPVFGYNVTRWLDAGVVVNYTYTSYSGGDFTDYKTRVSQYGGGVFTKIYPVKFLFLQAQLEHNFSNQKYIPDDGSPSLKQSFDGNSFLVGAGYSTSRDPNFKTPFFQLAILFDVSGNKYSPYADANGNAYPFISTGIQIPLFQGKNRNNYDDEEPRQGGGGKQPRNYYNRN